jgi:glycosyltransferase involved in cell wall biosynthesis
MREIVINGRFLSRRATGVERYGREIFKYIGGNCRVEMTHTNGVAGHAWEQFILPGRLKSESILWSPANTGPLMVPAQALTIHDLSVLEHPEWFKKRFALWYRLLLPLLAKNVRVIFTPSEYVKQKTLKQLGAKNVIVTPNGVDTAIFHPGTHRKIYGLPKKYILFVGSLQPRKNLAGLMKAWHMIKNDFKDTWLVVAGESGHVFRAVNFLGDERVSFMSYVSEIELPGLYAQAKLLVLPSFDEGFGLPAIEAMACGTPVIVSNGGALPEVVGDAGLVFELSDSNGLAETMRECLSNRVLRLALQEKGLARVENFTWQKTAALIWNTLNEL